MDEKVLNDYRSKLRTIGYSINKLDSVTDFIAENRFNMEFFRRHPEVGERDGQVVASAEKHKIAIDKGYAERERYLEILLYLVPGAETEEQARTAYLRMLAVYQRFAKLREQEQMVAAGFSESELENPFKGDLASELEEAFDALAALNEKMDVPEPSLISLP